MKDWSLGCDFQPDCDGRTVSDGRAARAERVWLGSHIYFRSIPRIEVHHGDVGNFPVWGRGKAASSFGMGRWGREGGHPLLCLVSLPCCMVGWFCPINSVCP